MRISIHCLLCKRKICHLSECQLHKYKYAFQKDLNHCIWFFVCCKQIIDLVKNAEKYNLSDKNQQYQ